MSSPKRRLSIDIIIIIMVWSRPNCIQIYTARDTNKPRQIPKTLRLSDFDFYDRSFSTMVFLHFMRLNYQWHSSHRYSSDPKPHRETAGGKKNLQNNFAARVFFYVVCTGLFYGIPSLYIYSDFKCIFIEFIGIYYPSGLGRPTDRQQQQQQKHHRPSS